MTACILVLSVQASTLAQSLVFPPYGHSYGIRKATPKHLFMFFGPRTFFTNPQGLACARLATWDDPNKKGDDDEVVVYGVNAGRGEIIFNTSMWTLGKFGGIGSGKGQFHHPRGIAADGKGNVFVADSGNNRVVWLFNPKSKLLWRSCFYGPVSGNKGMKGPSRVAVDEKALVYVTDPGNIRIVVFDTAGTVLRTIGTPNSAIAFEQGPTAIAVADGRARWSYFNHERLIFCADKSGSRVWKIGCDGTFHAKADMPRGFRASYGATDYYHNYWVTVPNKHSVVKFDHNLQMLDIFGSRGTRDNQFIDPRGITIYKRFGQVFIAEEKGAQYFWIGTELKNVSLTTATYDRYSLFTKLTEYARMTLFSVSGSDTVTYFEKRWTPCGTSTMVFSTGGKGRLPHKGLMLKVESTYSSFTYYSWVHPVKLKK
ncbi:MAG: NHL repeat-containing protein [Chitinispirillaceae bacterium]|nr:NHL repeat-containing protein [Chitinispirillaceae bacterium]